MKFYKIFIFVIQIFFISISLIPDLYSQTKDVNAVEVARSQFMCARVMTDELSKKLTLNQDQKKEVVNILLDYQDDLFAIAPSNSKYSKENYSEREDNYLTGSINKLNSQKLRDTETETNEKIESVLSGKQLSTYYRIKGEWWTHLKKITLHR